MTWQEQIIQDKKNLFLNYFKEFCKYDDTDGYYNLDTLFLIVTSQCNQKCEYCYLTNFRHLSYPPEADNIENIVRNFPLLLDYLHDTLKLKWTTYDIFSGEFFYFPEWEKIFQIILDFELKNNNQDHKEIIIPTNMSFLMNDKKTKKIEEWIDKLHQHNIHTFLSASVDGPKEVEAKARGLKDNLIKDDIFYDKLFKFLAKRHYTSHPMVSKIFLQNYKDNYIFWFNKFEEYNCWIYNQQEEKIIDVPMWLEVRNAEQWDTESLKLYREFLFFIAEYELEHLHKNNLTDFAIKIFDNFNEHQKYLGSFNHLQPHLLDYPEIKNRIPCSIQQGIEIRLGDLTWVPCHRTCYPHLNYGHFILNKEQNKIIDFENNNIELAYKITLFNPNRSMMQCADCEIKGFCAKGCLGAQYEKNKELFSPIQSVCNMYYVKYRTIHDIAEKYDLYSIVLKSPYISKERKDFITYARHILEKLELPY